MNNAFKTLYRVGIRFAKSIPKIDRPGQCLFFFDFESMKTAGKMKGYL